MSTPKPHIKLKADPWRQRMEPPDRDALPYRERDPAVFTERGCDGEQEADRAVLYYEDDCLR
jgi:hypothetical protein